MKLYCERGHLQIPLVKASLKAGSGSQLILLIRFFVKGLNFADQIFFS
jgi:hypothetical protein